MIHGAFSHKDSYFTRFGRLFSGNGFIREFAKVKGHPFYSSIQTEILKHSGVKLNRTLYFSLTKLKHSIRVIYTKNWINICLVNLENLTYNYSPIIKSFNCPTQPVFNFITKAKTRYKTTL